MKKFDPQSQVVIMCGISGSGKTHYARTLEKEGYIRLSSDALIWEKVGPGLYNLSKEEQRKLFAECRSELLNNFTRLLKSGEKVVLDSTNCKRAARDKLRNICAEIELKPIFIYCHTDKEELWKRLSQRKGEGPDELLVTQEQLSEYLSGFECPEDSENDFIFLNTDDLPTQ